MISDLDRSLGSRYFLNVANERTCFASCTSAFKSSGLITCLEYAFRSVFQIGTLNPNSINERFSFSQFIQLFFTLPGTNQ